ncbi:UNVERIFIED_ORG: hypothetical protein QFZ59_002511 [Bacillus sp. B2I3]|nr:hypothetical protein [Bacillus sp. B2I3]
MKTEQLDAHIKMGQKLQSQLKELQANFKLPIDKGGNTAIGIIDEKGLPFYADSKLNDEEAYTSFTGFQDVAIPCFNFFGDITLPMRLTPDLNFYHPKERGFTKGKEKCSERKILNEMIRELKKRKEQDKELTIHIYSEKEPCVYCFIAIKVQLALVRPNLQVKVYYEQLLSDMITYPEAFSPEYKIK